MLRYIDSEKMGRSLQVWLDSHFHFSFAEYFNPQNMNFGILRVVNDDLVEPGTGFQTHPHKDMEILSYVVDGQLSHADSMGNERTLTRGQVQYMSAGTGVYHSELNHGDGILRFLQIWILPDKANHTPNYGDVPLRFEDRINQWLPIAAGNGEGPKVEAPIHLNADANAYATYIEAGKQLDFDVAPDRQAYMILIEGSAKVGDVQMSMRDALEITGEDIRIDAVEDAHVFLIEMAKDGDNILTKK